MRRRLAVGLVVIALLALALVLVRRARESAPECGYDTIEKIAFEGGTIDARRRKPQDERVEAVLTQARRLTPCEKGEAQEACLARAKDAYGEIPGPADHLKAEARLEGSALTAVITPALFREIHRPPTESVHWKPDAPGNVLPGTRLETITDEGARVITNMMLMKDGGYWGTMTCVGPRAGAAATTTTSGE